MRHAITCLSVMGLLLTAAPARAQDEQAEPTPTEVAPGVFVWDNGTFEFGVGDIIAEVLHYDQAWAGSQQHNAFTVAEGYPEKSEGKIVISGEYNSAGGLFTLTETFENTDDGVKYTAALNSDSQVSSNELSAGFSLPVDVFGDKQIMIDDNAVTLPREAPVAGSAHIMMGENARKIVLTSEDGTLTITGDMTILLQDNREWGDFDYGLRINFTPSQGQYNQSNLELMFQWVPNEEE